MYYFFFFFAVHTVPLSCPPCFSRLQDEPELYFTDPQQLLELVTELTEQNLSLFHISTRVEETLKELRQSMDTTKKNM